MQAYGFRWMGISIDGTYPQIFNTGILIRVNPFNPCSIRVLSCFKMAEGHKCFYSPRITRIKNSIEDNSNKV
jgi:hypothetical protein